MAAQPFYSPKFRAFDANGDPLSGGKLYTYAAGTSTPLATYTTRAGDVANSNPVILNANGEADVWTIPGVSYKYVLKDSTDATQWTVDNVPSLAGTTATSDDGMVEPGGRLTLTTGTPVTSADVTGATTAFYVPHKHGKVPLYDGSAWALYTLSAELSQATSDNTKSPAAVTADKNYDLFIWNDAGTLRLSRGPPWTSDTARGTGAGSTELDVLGTRRVNKNAISNGPAAQRGLYVGTLRSDGSSQFNDSMAKRHVWNAYYRVRRPMRATDAALSWSYAADAWRQANANAANQLDFVMGLAGDDISAEVLGCFQSDYEAALGMGVGIGFDSTTANSAIIYSFHRGATVAHLNIAGSNMEMFPRATYQGFAGIGRHTLVWLEHGNPAGTATTWRGTSVGGAIFTVTCGIWGHVFA